MWPLHAAGCQLPTAAAPGAAMSLPAPQGLPVAPQLASWTATGYAQRGSASSHQKKNKAWEWLVIQDYRDYAV